MSKSRRKKSRWNIWMAIGSVIDVAGTSARARRRAKTDEEAWAQDQMAMSQDWDEVGQDLRDAMDAVGKEAGIERVEKVVEIDGKKYIDVTLKRTMPKNGAADATE